MPIYLFKCQKCKKEHDFFLRMSQEKEREEGIQCSSCGGHCERIFINPSMAYVKHTYVGDIFDKANVKTGQDAVIANRERIKEMRKKNAR